MACRLASLQMAATTVVCACVNLVSARSYTATSASYQTAHSRFVDVDDHGIVPGQDGLTEPLCPGEESGHLSVTKMLTRGPIYGAVFRPPF